MLSAKLNLLPLYSLTYRTIYFFSSWSDLELYPPWLDLELYPPFSNGSTFEGGCYSVRLLLNSSTYGLIVRFPLSAATGSSNSTEILSLFPKPGLNLIDSSGIDWLYIEMEDLPLAYGPSSVMVQNDCTSNLFYYIWVSALWYFTISFSKEDFDWLLLY